MFHHRSSFLSLYETVQPSLFPYFWQWCQTIFFYEHSSKKVTFQRFMNTSLKTLPFSKVWETKIKIALRLTLTQKPKPFKNTQK